MIRLALHHLAMIHSLGSTGSVSATARELGLTQPAISHRMKEAERRAGTTLFYRDGHALSLNTAGRRLFQSAEIILAEAALAERDLERLSSGFNHRVRIGAACYAGFEWFPALRAYVRRDLPKVSVEIISDISEDPAVLVKNNLADLVLTAAPVEHANITSIPLKEDQLVAVLPKDHTLAEEAFIQPLAFEAEPYVTHHTLAESGREYEKIFKPAGIMPPEVISAGRTMAVLELVRDGQAITILPCLSVQRHAARMDLILRPVTKPGIAIHWYALVRKKTGQTDMTETLVDLLKVCL